MGQTGLSSQGRGAGEGGVGGRSYTLREAPVGRRELPRGLLPGADTTHGCLFWSFMGMNPLFPVDGMVGDGAHVPPVPVKVTPGGNDALRVLWLSRPSCYVM